MSIFDCDTESSASVAYVLSNEELNNSKLFNLLFTYEINIVIEDKLPLNTFAIEELIDEDIKICDDEIEELVKKYLDLARNMVFILRKLSNFGQYPCGSCRVVSTMFWVNIVINEFCHSMATKIGASFALSLYPRDPLY